jgi:hypothetical protein
MSHFRVTPVEVMDTWVIQASMHHVKSTCILGHKPHHEAECFAKLLDRWQHKRIFQVAKEEKIDFTGVKVWDMTESGIIFAKRAEEIYENIDSVYIKNDAEYIEEQ